MTHKTDTIRPEDFSIVAFTDTFGSAHQNGVARFIGDTLHQAQQQRRTLDVYTSSAHIEERDGLHNVDAPRFGMPGYPALEIAWPLQRERQRIREEMEDADPAVIHVSTPGPIGWMGRDIADRLEKPIVGIYHTDFPAYARAVTRKKLTEIVGNPLPWIVPILSAAQPIMRPLMQKNPELVTDAMQIASLTQKNYTLLLKEFKDHPEMVADCAKQLVDVALRAFYQPFTLVIARSAIHHDALLRDIGIPEDRIRNLPPGIDTDRFHPRHRDTGVWEKFGIPSNTVKILHVGRVSAEKNIQFLAETWQRVRANQRRSDAPLALVMVGSGDAEADFPRLAGRRLVYMLGPQHGETLSQLYASSDMFVFPSVTETLGQVGMEAGASGLPVLVTNRGGPQTYVQDGETGYILPPDDPALWAEKILRLARTTALRDRMGNAARGAMEQYGFERSFEQYWEIHREAVAQHTSRVQHPFLLPSARSHVPDLHVRAPYTRGTLYLSDIHIGKRWKRQGNIKQHALEQMLTLAQQRRLDVVFGGDVGDRRTSSITAKQESAVLRRCTEKLEGTVTYVYGNHDDNFSAEEIRRLIGPCTIAPSLLSIAPHTGVAYTHGHLLELPSAATVLQSDHDPDTFASEFSPKALEKELHWFSVKYDWVVMAEQWLRRHGLSGVGDCWEVLLHRSGPVRLQLASLLRNVSDHATLKYFADIIDFRNYTEMAARLGYVTRGWATVTGHSHEPGLQKFSLEHEGNTQTMQLLGNCGSFVSMEHNPTCIIAAFPHLYLLEYVPERGELVIRQEESLTVEEVEKHVQLLQAKQTKQQCTAVS